MQITRPVVAAMTPAQRARTVVAACRAVRWPGADEVAVPFVEQGGSLLLVVTPEQRQQLLESEGGCVRLDARALGSVRLSGHFWPVATAAARDVLDGVRACHAECLNCPSQRLSQLVGLDVDVVEWQAPDGRRCQVDLDAYTLAAPDHVLALGAQLQQHVNAAHGDDVLEAACALVGRRSEQVLSAQLDWIDGSGYEVSLIDESGGRRLRYDFPNPVVDPDRLPTVLRNCLAQAAASAEDPPTDA